MKCLWRARRARAQPRTSFIRTLHLEDPVRRKSCLELVRMYNRCVLIQTVSLFFYLDPSKHFFLHHVFEIRFSRRNDEGRKKSKFNNIGLLYRFFLASLPHANTPVLLPKTALWCQGPPIDYFASRPWNAGNTIPFHQWLVEEKCDQHKQRMDTLGNVVVPHQAFLAMSVLSRLMSGEFF